MANWVAKYVLAAAVAAAVAGAAFGPYHCTEVFGCVGGESTTQAWVLVVGLGAAVGLVAMAIFDIAVNARYALANRAEAKRRPLALPAGDRSDSGLSARSVSRRSWVARQHFPRTTT